MKRIILASIVLISIGIGFSACSKNDSVYNSPVGIAAKINGLQWNSSTTTVTQNNVSGQTYLTITGQITGNRQDNISLTLQNYTGMGTYKISPIWSSASYNYGTAEHTAATGTIVVTNSTATFVQGTFTFQAEDSTYVITSGTFNTSLKQ
ncbi:MAG: hypothetical protein WCG87_10490 [Bacteroidota bacterium]